MTYQELLQFVHIRVVLIQKCIDMAFLFLIAHTLNPRINVLLLYLCFHTVFYSLIHKEAGCLM